MEDEEPSSYTMSEMEAEVDVPYDEGTPSLRIIAIGDTLEADIDSPTIDTPKNSILYRDNIENEFNETCKEGLECRVSDSPKKKYNYRKKDDTITYSIFNNSLRYESFSPILNITKSGMCLMGIDGTEKYLNAKEARELILYIGGRDIFDLIDKHSSLEEAAEELKDIYKNYSELDDDEREEFTIFEYVNTQRTLDALKTGTKFSL